MLIPDGYTELVEAGTLGPIAYRPMLRPERIEFLRLVSGMDDIDEIDRGRMFSRVMARHVVLSVHSSADLERVLCESWEHVDRSWWMTLMRAVVNPGGAESEAEDARNLHRGLLVREFYPHLLERGCDYCLKHWYDPLTNQTAKIENGLRPAGALPLCETRGLTCPLGHHARPFRLSQKNARAIEFDAECRDSGSWPDDPIARRNSRVITHALRTIRQHRRPQ